jgi:hypothetical protein
MQPEIPLAGGNATSGVVRVGDTVRKPWTQHSAGVLAYLRVLHARGITVPEPLGRDPQGRMTTGYVAGPLANDAPPRTPPQLAGIGALVRSIHDASEGLDADVLGLGPSLIPVAAPDLVCHGDLAPWNLVLGHRPVFIDWDGAAASTRLWDLAYSAQSFTVNDPAADPQRAADDLRAFVDGYGADPPLRAGLAATLAPRAWAMHDLLASAHRAGREPWGSMYLAGHGAHWRGVARFIDAHAAVWDDALRRG